MKVEHNNTGLEIAIIGMSCRLPGAKNWRELWQNLIKGVESIKSPNGNFKAKNGEYVNATSKIDGKEYFDPSFFGYTKWEAEALNPTHRIFHQCVWEALEDAGYPPQEGGLDASLYAGAGDDTLWRAYSLLKGGATNVDDFTQGLLANKDSIATLVAYRLNLLGPAVTVNTACSTSLTAVHHACRSLLFEETEIAIAGGISLQLSNTDGYIYNEGQINSSDGHCRAFDLNASGTVGGEGSAVVVLKKLEKAIADNDHIYGVIKGSASNNDGKGKIGYTAPGIDGQSKCIISAQKMSNVSPESISYIEAHGTGTRIGDPIEIEALNKAFEFSIEQQCAVGSVKTNIGHTDTAAGIVGLIKVALSLKHKVLPPSLHYNEPNPTINFKNGPFFVNNTLKKWERKSNLPLRAGVSSFGIGGTNVHVVVEEAPEIQQEKPAQPLSQIILSAQTEKALSKQIKHLHAHLKAETGVDLNNLSNTLLFGRKTFAFRKAITYQDYNGLVDSLAQSTLLDGLKKAGKGKTKVIFVIPDLKAKNLKPLGDLYLSEKIFKENIDKGLEILEEITGENHQSYLCPSGNEVATPLSSKYSTALMFIYNHAFSMLLVSAGVQPDYLIGQRNGEYNAACLSGVLDYKDCIKLLTKIPPQEEGDSVSISTMMSKEQAMHYTSDGLTIADSNDDSLLVFKGGENAIKLLREELDMDGILNRFFNDQLDNVPGLEFEQLKWGNIKIPYISSITGDFARKNEITTKKYWLSKLPRSSNFLKGVHALEESENEITYINIGTGNQLVKLLQGEIENSTVLSFYKNDFTTRESYLDGLGKLWEKGFRIDWKTLYDTKTLRKIPLPTYPFEEEKFTTFVNFEELMPTENGKNDTIIETPVENGKNDMIIENPVDNGKNDISIETPVENGENDISIENPLPIQDLQNQDQEDKVNALPVLAAQDLSYDSILKTVIQIIEESLSITDVKETDDFFELGGDSLKGMQFINTVKGVYNVDMTLHDFLDCQTLADIAGAIEKFKANSLNDNTITI